MHYFQVVLDLVVERMMLDGNGKKQVSFFEDDKVFVFQ